MMVAPKQCKHEQLQDLPTPSGLVPQCIACLAILELEEAFPLGSLKAPGSPSPDDFKEWTA